MIKTVVIAASLLATCALAGAAHAAGPVTAEYYNPGDYSENYGVGITFSGTPFQTDQIETINNFSNPDPQVGNSDPNFPSANLYFAADYTSAISVAATGMYSLSDTSDDGGYLFVDRSLVTDTPGNHLPETSSGDVLLTAGTHELEFQMDNAGGPCCAQATVTLPMGVTYVSAAPEPSSWALMIAGVGLIGSALRFGRRRGAMVAS